MATVAVIAAGAMGSAVGRRLVQNGCIVWTNLDGRSDATRRRAAECGMKDVPLSQIAAQANYLLSILPPSNAFSFAEEFLRISHAGSQQARTEPLVFVDCNAVNPVTVKKMGGLFAQFSNLIQFVDSGIIGGPPKDEYNPTFYASAADEKVLERFGVLSKYGLKTSLLKGGDGVGDASALKMSYAGITKGTTAIITTMILAAQAASPATAEALLNELSYSQPQVLRRVIGGVPSMLPKAYRWVGEMEEIAEFVGEGEGETYKGIAKLYSRIERSLKEDGEDIRVLRKFVEEASKKEVKK